MDKPLKSFKIAVKMRLTIVKQEDFLLKSNQSGRISQKK